MIRLVLDKTPKRWEGITEDDRALWAKTYPGVDLDGALQEMIAFWDAQPPAKRKKDWKRAIVNRLKWLQENGNRLRPALSGPARPDPAADPADWFWKGKIPKGPDPK